MSVRHVVQGLMLFGLVSVTDSLDAQVDVPPTHGWMVGAALGVPGAGRDAAPELLTIGIHATGVRAGRLGADLAVGTAPRAVTLGVLALGARAGVTMPLALAPGVFLLPVAGWSAVGALGFGDARGVFGGYVGGSVLHFDAGQTGMRFGVTMHRFVGGNATPDNPGWLWLIEAEIVWRPRQPTARSP